VWPSIRELHARTIEALTDKAATAPAAAAAITAEAAAANCEANQEQRGKEEGKEKEEAQETEMGHEPKRRVADTDLEPKCRASSDTGEPQCRHGDIANKSYTIINVHCQNICSLVPKMEEIRRVAGQRKDEKAPHVMVYQESMTQQDRNLVIEGWVREGISAIQGTRGRPSGGTEVFVKETLPIPRMKIQSPTKGEVIALELAAGSRQRKIALVFAYWQAGRVIKTESGSQN
jgi:hypothetical protein